MPAFLLIDNFLWLRISILFDQQSQLKFSQSRPLSATSYTICFSTKFKVASRISYKVYLRVSETYAVGGDIRTVRNMNIAAAAYCMIYVNFSKNIVDDLDAIIVFYVPEGVFSNSVIY